MNTTFNTNGKVSIEMTEKQYWMMQRCFSLISEHLDYDEELDKYTVQVLDIVAAFDEDELNTIKSIEL